MDTLQLRQSIYRFSNVDFSRSGGPGGQNVNKVNTRVSLRIKLDELYGLSQEEKDMLKEKLSSRITKEGELLIHSNEERSQHLNLERAYNRMEALIISAARLNKIRHATKPSKAAREERLKAKRIRSIRKAERSYRNED